MKFKREILSTGKFNYEVDRKEFNRLMNIKKTAERYDRKGQKHYKVDIESKVADVVKTHKPERIKNEFMKGPFVVVFVSTVAEVGESFLDDHYVKQGTLLIEEGDAVRVYRDSMNDGFTNAHFCDDSVMLLAIKDKNGEKFYFEVEGEPTGYGSWKFDEDFCTEEQADHFKEILNAFANEAAQTYNLPKEQVYVVIQLENV